MTSTTTTPGGLERPAVRRRRRKLTFDRVSFMAVFLILPLAIFVIFVISPFVQALYYSLTDWTGFSPTMDFVGLSNYVKLFGDDIFLHALRNNVLLAVVVPFVTIVLALAISVMITIGGPSKGMIRGLKGSSFYRVISFFPYTVPAIVIGLIWAEVYDPSAGLLNGVLTGLGLKGFADFPWLGDTRTAMPVSMFVIVWSFVGFYTVLFVAAIKGVPAETLEAARLDGAGRLRMAVSIVIPQIRDNVQTAYIYLGIAALDAFVYMQAMNPGGGPDNSTLTMSQELFTVAFRKGQFGYATAMGVVLAAVTLLFAAVVFTVSRLTAGRDVPRAASVRRAEAAAPLAKESRA
ncbi:carbohydrate ABC transporter permease [Gryllotalpicola ginsengisoli]|uniref:carbohydrate ABC transporter permease n=1 Tax=Gryllotalpicola ginsengisoli TaxID=444608 RepID=UPI0003B5CE29|nr:sugar ABC transporter permease [Gryllotalpicola ginsengisoli]